MHLYPLYESQRIQVKLFFFALNEPIYQDADGLYDAIKRAFSDKKIKTLLKNVVFFSSDGTNVGMHA